MSARKPEIQAAYEQFKHTYSGSCPFCDVSSRNPNQIIETIGGIAVLRNDFPYHEWDNFTVDDHLMAVPVRHVGSFDEFTEDEARNFFETIKKYEANHYSLYSRAPSNLARSVAHLHTHLIKPIGY